MRKLRRWCRHHEGAIAVAIFLALVMLAEAFLLWGTDAAQA